MEDGFIDDVLAVLPRFLGRLPDGELRTFTARLSREHVQSGTLLYRQGDRSDCMHFVVTGRLEVRVRDRHGDPRLVTRLAAGDCVGELSLLTGEARAADVLVTRDAVLARLAREDYETLVARHPEVGLDIARFALRTLRQGSTEFVPEVRSIGVVPLAHDVPIAQFARRLELALLRFGSSAYVDSTIVEAKRARHPRDRTTTEDGRDTFVDRLLDEAERKRRFVIAVADAGPTAWTRRCVAHADHVLFVAHAAARPEHSPIEQALFDSARNGAFMQKELVLLHPSRRATPSGTAAWLASRTGYRHAHVAWEGSGDFDRLARLLANQGVALVLGGGGARGFAQIGVIRAIREAGIPIDAVGGTSIGAIIGGLVALGWMDEQILQSCKHAFVDDRPLDDVTMPFFSLLSGRKLARTLHHYIGDVDIEDLWQPYFCVSSNLSESRVHVHRNGRLWRAMQASAALPGLLPPTVADGQLYVDGGLLDNLPVGEMKRFIGGRTIAVDATVKQEYSVDADEFPSPFRYLRTRLTRRARSPMPTLPSVLIKSTLLAGAGGRKELREGVDLYVNPPVRPFGFLDWDAIYAIVEAGYRHGEGSVRAWLEADPDLRWRDESLPFPAENMAA